VGEDDTVLNAIE